MSWQLLQPSCLHTPPPDSAARLPALLTWPVQTQTTNQCRQLWCPVVKEKSCTVVHFIDTHCGGCASHCLMHYCSHPAIALAVLIRPYGPCCQNQIMNPLHYPNPPPLLNPTDAPKSISNAPKSISNAPKSISNAPKSISNTSTEQLHLSDRHCCCQ